MKFFIGLSVLLAFGACSSLPSADIQTKTNSSCTVTKTQDGAIVTCPDGSEVFIPQGENGKDGIDGQDGQDGRDGTDGKNGENGIDGKDGLDGTNGIDGQNGENGKDASIPTIVLCGSEKAHAEIAMKVGDQWVVYFENGNGSARRLTILVPGIVYVSTDGIQTCRFTTEDLDEQVKSKEKKDDK